MSAEYSPGLEGVTAGISAISEVDAERDRLTYRGYDVHDLVDQCAFDEVAYLLLFGHLPNSQEYADFQTRVGENRNVPPVVYDLFRQFPADAHPMDTLKAAIAVLAAFDPERDFEHARGELKQSRSAVRADPHARCQWLSQSCRGSRRLRLTPNFATTPTFSRC